MRIFLRLEALLLRLESHLKHPSQLAFQSAIFDLINVLHIFTCRVDLKAELIKEMERHQTLLTQFLSNPDANQDTLNELLSAIKPLLEELYNSDMTPGHALKKNEFIKAIIQRSGIPGGTCNFDLPNYHMWLNRPLEEQRYNLQAWYDSYSTASRSILLILNIIRNSVLPQKNTAEKGFMQLQLDKSRPFQMLHVKIDRELKVYPEISGNKHRCVIRFMQFSIEERPKQTKEDIPFLLTCCQL